MQAATLRRAGFEQELVGATLYGVPGDVIQPLTTYLLRLPEMLEKGRGLALCGGMGTRKTGTLALISEAACTYLPPPFSGEAAAAPRALVMYRRMPKLMRFLGLRVPFERQAVWDAEFHQLTRVPFLLVDEFHVHAGGDYGADMLLELMDIRATAPCVTCLAMNGLWDELTRAQHPVLRQLREKLAPRTKELRFTGASRRADGWEWE